MEAISIWVAGTPKPQPRVRFSRKSGHAYTPDSADEWKAAVEEAVAGQVREPLDGPLALRLEFYLARPAKHFTKTSIRKDAPKYVTKKPDLDNLAKAVMDALSDAGVWIDDCQVVEISGVKYFGDPTGCRIEIRSQQ